MITDASGVQVANYEYTPYGSFISHQSPVTSYLFTGKELDSTGLYYYGARYYNPELAHFTQPDPIIQNVFDPQTLNHYSYARNNPLIYTDPTGLAFENFRNSISNFGSSIWNNFSSGVSAIGNWGRQVGTGVFRSFNQTNPQGLNGIRQRLYGLGQNISQGLRNFGMQYRDNLRINIQNISLRMDDAFSRLKSDIYYTRLNFSIDAKLVMDAFQRSPAGDMLTPTPERTLRLTGTTLKAFGYVDVGNPIGWIGTAVEPGGWGKKIGMTVGGTFVGGLGSLYGYSLGGPKTAIALGILGNMVGGYYGGKFGSIFDLPQAEYVNYGELNDGF